jgi:hypothetical protein
MVRQINGEKKKKIANGLFACHFIALRLNFIYFTTTAAIFFFGNR